MSRTCTICPHDQRARIDRALIARTPFRHIAAQYGVSTSALVRHCDDHIPSSLIRAQRVKEATEADALMAQILDLRDKALDTLTNAENDKNWPATVAAIRTACGCLELLGKVAGQLQDAPTINIIMTPEWQAVQAGILAALKPYPVARLAVAASLEIHHAPGHA